MRLQLGSWIGFLKLQEWHKWRGVRSWLGWLSWTPSNAKWWEFWFVDLDFYYKIILIKRHDACHNTRKYRHLFEQFVSFLQPQQNSRNRDKIWRCWWLPRLTPQKVWFRNLRACGSKRILMPQWEISNLSAHPAYSKNMLWAHNHVISLLSTCCVGKLVISLQWSPIALLKSAVQYHHSGPVATTRICWHAITLRQTL